MRTRADPRSAKPKAILALSGGEARGGPHPLEDIGKLWLRVKNEKNARQERLVRTGIAVSAERPMELLAE